jgi:uncharacterized membrane protein YbhN (UPF0104 family)
MERLRRNPRQMLLAALALAAGGAALVAADGDFANVADALTPFRAGWVAIAFGAQVFAFAGYTLAYRRIIALHDGPRLSPSLVVRLVMTGFGAFAPGGGFAIDYQAVKALEGDERAATVRVLALGALEYVVIAPAACVAAAAMLVFGSDAMPSVLWPWAIAVPVGFGVGFWAATRNEDISRGRRGKMRRILDDALAGIELIRQMSMRPLSYLPALLGIAAYWGGEVVSLWACLRAVDVTLGVGPLIVGLATGYALTRRSMPLAGAGITEALLSFALVWVGVGLPSALVAVVIYRLLSFVLPMLPALWARQGVVHLIEPEAAAASAEAGTR